MPSARCLGRAPALGGLWRAARLRARVHAFRPSGAKRPAPRPPRRRPPPAARDAEEAARQRDGYDFFGSRLRVEVARGGNPRGPFGGGGMRIPPRGSGHRVTVRGLPPSASWQDLKARGRGGVGWGGVGSGRVVGAARALPTQTPIPTPTPNPNPHPPTATPKTLNP
jgi:hypothetical protein